MPFASLFVMPNSINSFPWLIDPWRRLDDYFAMDRVPHALLIHGQEGVGKHILAEQFVQKLLCENPCSFACGSCSACRLYSSGSHPDFLRVEPLEQGQAILVDHIREMISDIQLKSHYQGFRVVLIRPAHLMNSRAANSLLKSLEEPPARTVMLLLADNLAGLPLTIRSRCLKMPVPQPGRAEAAEWLEAIKAGCQPLQLLAATGGSPLKALALADSDIMERKNRVLTECLAVLHGKLDPVSLAERWQPKAKDKPENRGPTLAEFIDWMILLSSDLINLSFDHEYGKMANAGMRDALRRLADKLERKRLFGFYDQLIAARGQLGSNLNSQLQFEDLLINWHRLSETPKTEKGLKNYERH